MAASADGSGRSGGEAERPPLLRETPRASDGRAGSRVRRLGRGGPEPASDGAVRRPADAFVRCAASVVLAAAAVVCGTPGAARGDPRPPAPCPLPDEETTDVAVLVADPEGKPIDGANLRVLDGDREVAAARTDATGSATLSGLPRRDVRLSISAEGRFPATGVLHAGAVNEHVDPRRGPVVFGAEWTPDAARPGAAPSVSLALARLADVTVEGAPAGARVVGRVVAGRIEFQRMRGVTMQVHTQGTEALLATLEGTADEEGACVLHGVPSKATLVVRVESPGVACRAVAAEVHDGERTTTLRVDPSRTAWTLSGKVLDAAAKPVPGARVHVAPTAAPVALADPSRPPESGSRDPEDVPLAWTVTADASGAYAVPFLETGRTYAARAEADGGLATPVTWDLAAPEDAEAPSATGARIVVAADFTLAPRVSVEGRVVDQSGVAPPRGMVRLIATPRDDGVERRAEITDGAFRFDALLPGRYALVAEGRGFLRTVDTLVVDPKAAGPATVRVDAGTVISRKVVDLGGKPVAGVVVQAFDPEVEALQVIRYPIGEQRAETAADGAFRLAGLTAGAWNVRLFAPDGTAAPVVRVTAPAKDVVVAIGPPPRLRFGIKRPEGVEMKQVRLGVFRLVGDGVPYAAGAWDREAMTESVAAFKDLPADEDVIVRFVVPGHPPYMQTLRLVPGEVRDLGVLEPPEGHVVEGVVRDSDGDPVEGVDVRAERSGGGEATTDAEGRFRLENVGGGTQRLRLSLIGRDFIGTEDLEVTLPAKDPLALTIRRHANVTGRATTFLGKPIRGRVVFHAVRPWGRLARPERCTTEADGSFQILLAPERYRVMVYDGSSDRALGPAVQVEVVEKPKEPLDLVFPDR